MSAVEKVLGIQVEPLAEFAQVFLKEPHVPDLDYEDACFALIDEHHPVLAEHARERAHAMKIRNYDYYSGFCSGFRFGYHRIVDHLKAQRRYIDITEDDIEVYIRNVHEHSGPTGPMNLNWLTVKLGNDSPTFEHELRVMYKTVVGPKGEDFGVAFYTASLEVTGIFFVKAEAMALRKRFQS